jgi:hypothetical protein
MNGKKIYSIVLFSVFSLNIFAQDVVASFLDKYGKDEGLEWISIGKKMFDKMEKQSLGTPELRETIQGLENIQIITSEDAALSEAYYNSAIALLSKDTDYTELFSMDMEDQQITVKMKGTKSAVNELIILLSNSDGFNLISMLGKNINLSLLAQYSLHAGWKDLQKLKNLEDKN